MDQPGGNCEARISLLIKMRTAIAILLLAWSVVRIYNIIIRIISDIEASHVSPAFGIVSTSSDSIVTISLIYINNYLGIVLLFAGIILLLRKPFATKIASLTLIIVAVLTLIRVFHSNAMPLIDAMHTHQSFILPIIGSIIFGLANTAIYPVIIYLLALLKNDEAIITRDMAEHG